MYGAAEESLHNDKPHYLYIQLVILCKGQYSK